MMTTLRSLRSTALILAVASGMAALVARVAPASACSLAGNEMHHVDAAHASDTTAPGAVSVTATVARYYEDEGGGCTGSHVASCGSYGLVTLAASATDDATAAEDLGYQISVVRGQGPRDFNVPAMPVRSFGGSGGEIYLYFSVTDAPGFEVDLEIRAVDLNGNVGPATVLKVVEAS